MKFDSNVYLAYNLGTKLSDFNSKEIGTIIFFVRWFCNKTWFN